MPRLVLNLKEALEVKHPILWSRVGNLQQNWFLLLLVISLVAMVLFLIFSGLYNIFFFPENNLARYHLGLMIIFGKDY